MKGYVEKVFDHYHWYGLNDLEVPVYTERSRIQERRHGLL